MNTMLAILQGTTADFTWNYIILGVLVVLAVVLGLSVMKNRQQDI